MVVAIPQSVRNTGESMRVWLAAEKQENRAMLHIILQNSKYLAHQGHHIHCLVTAMIQKVIFKLPKLRVEDVTTLTDWSERKTNK